MVTHLAQIVEKPAHEGGLPRVDVAHDDQIEVVLDAGTGAALPLVLGHGVQFGLSHDDLKQTFLNFSFL